MLYLELENGGASFEELEKLTLGGLRKAVVDGDVNSGSFMMGQIAGMIKEEKSMKDIIEGLIASLKQTYINLIETMEDLYD